MALYSDFEQQVGEARENLEMAPHSGLELDVESLLGQFVDASWAYRFGPPAQDLIVASLERDSELLAQSVFLPAGRPTATEPPERLGIQASASRKSGGAMELSVRGSRFVYGLRVEAPGFASDDDAFSIEPGEARTVMLRPLEDGVELSTVTLTALNMRGRFPVSPD